MKLESRMSLGYIKGQRWVPDDRFHACEQWPEYKRLFPALRNARPGGVAFECKYSYVAARYSAEIMTIERFQGSGQPYMLKYNMAYDSHPMAAISRAIRESQFCTPLLAVLCLELELRILLEVTSIARQREHREEQMLATAFDLFTQAIRAVPHE